LFGGKVRIQHLFSLGTTAKEIAKKLCRRPVSICNFKTLPMDELPPPPTKRLGRKRLSNGRLDNRLRH
jgi:hypothetical protein